MVLLLLQNKTGLTVSARIAVTASSAGAGYCYRRRDVAWSIFLFACMLGTRVSCAETPEPTEMPFWGEHLLGPDDWFGLV